MRPDERFPLTRVPGVIAYFLDTDRRRYLFFICVLGIVQFYPMLPPYLIGRVADFLIAWRPGTDLAPMYLTIATLGVAHAGVALVRLSTKRVIGRMAIDARMRAKVWGFERLIGFSLGWHQKESTGNKAQRVLTGADAVRDWTGELVNALLTAAGAFFGALIACMLLHPATVFFFLYYCGVLGFIEWYFYRRIAKLSDQINASMENASGSFVESAANILSVKAMNAGADMTARVAAREQAARDFAYRRLRLTNTKWMLFQLHTALAWALYIYGVARGVMEGGLSVGMVLTYSAYFNTLREASMDMTDRVQTMIERTSNLGRMMPLFAAQTAQPGTQDWPACSTCQSAGACSARSTSASRAANTSASRAAPAPARARWSSCCSRSIRRNRDCCRSMACRCPTSVPTRCCTGSPWYRRKPNCSACRCATT